MTAVNKGERFWFYRPELGLGWPFGVGHDEYARRTVWLGFPFTGQVVFAYKDCGDPECEADMRRWMAEEGDL